MATAKVAVTVDSDLLREIDRSVAAGEFKSRSSAVRAGLRALLEQRAARPRLLAELAKLDAAGEQALAEEGLSAETSWPPY